MCVHSTFSIFGTGCWGFESLLGHHSLERSNAKRGKYLPALVCAIQPSYSQTFVPNGAVVSSSSHSFASAFESWFVVSSCPWSPSLSPPISASRPSPPAGGYPVGRDHRCPQSC